jgi:hypothetical protein
MVFTLGWAPTVAAPVPAVPDSVTLAATPEPTGATPGQTVPVVPESTVVVPVASDTSVVVEVPAGTAIDSIGVAPATVSPGAKKRTAPAVAAKKERHVEPPYRIVLRSLLYPGWGQLYNGKSLKALAVFVSEGSLLGMIYSESRAASRAYDKHLVATDDTRAAELYSEYEDHFNREESLSWWAVGLVLLSLADAYVDANLITFEEEFGEPGEGGGRGGGPAVSGGGKGGSGTGNPRGKVSMSVQPDQSLAGGFLCLRYGF